MESRTVFPLEISFAKIKPGEAAKRWNELRLELLDLRKQSAEARPGKSYEVIWEERRDRLSGAQSLPSRICFPDEISYLSYIGKSREAARFRADLALIVDAFPDLAAWAAAKPIAVVEHGGDWPRILDVLAWFRINPNSGLYLREIPAVEDTKFIERNKPILRALLDLIAPAEAERAGNVSFEERFGLKTIQPLIRLRLLDRSIAEATFSGIDDLALPLDRLASLDLPAIRRVLVIENKTSFGNAEVFLTAPAMRGTVAFFGSGYASRSLEVLSWLASRSIAYWGDIDSHGLRILGAFRTLFPAVEAVMMDEETFDRYPEYRSDAPQDEASAPTGLHDEEMRLFQRLVSQSGGNRLEQERIPLHWARTRLAEWSQRAE